MKGSRRSVGAFAERTALRAYRRRGYKKVCTNFTVKGGEIDLVVRNGEYLVFVEVKARKKGSTVSALEAVTAEKQRRITRTAIRFMAECEPALCSLQPRFDVVAVELSGIFNRVTDVIENAFDFR